MTLDPHAPAEPLTLAEMAQERKQHSNVWIRCQWCRFHVQSWIRVPVNRAMPMLGYMRVHWFDRMDRHVKAVHAAEAAEQARLLAEQK
jgi:hypothetical protein